jgi:hypothetical protein
MWLRLHGVRCNPLLDESEKVIRWYITGTDIPLRQITSSPSGRQTITSEPKKVLCAHELRRIVELMFIRKMIGLILAGVLSCATSSFGSFCELHCNTAPQSHSHSDLPGHHHDAHHDMSNCQDCANHGARFSMNDSSCHHIDQAQLLDKSVSDLNLSRLKWQAVGSYAVSKSPSRGGRATPGFSNPFVPRQSSISAPLTLSLRI